MKLFLTLALGVACIGLSVALVMVKQGGNAQHEADAGAIDGLSNQLTSAQAQVASGNGVILALSNSLGQSQSAALGFSNQLAGTQSAVASGLGQITDLDHQLLAAKSENHALGQSIATLTNQVASMASQTTALTSKIFLTQSELAHVNQDYALLENRLRRDVAERLVVERKFNNPLELQGRLQFLKTNPVVVVSEESIYAGLDVEVKSNAFHVISQK